MSAPLLFLDVDGVVLPLGAELDDLHPDLGRRLAELPAELVWATAWEHGANLDIAPRIGVPLLPVVEWREPSAAQDALDDYFNLHWKTRQVVEWAAGRDFAWADDEVTAFDREWVAANHPGRALVHHVRALLGLTGADFDVLARWLYEVRGEAYDGRYGPAGDVDEDAADGAERDAGPEEFRPAAS